MKIAAWGAGLGAAVGSVLFLVLRFVAGPSVLAGVSHLGVSSGTPRRYADYLPTVTALSGSGVVRVLPVLLGSGLVAGLLVGVVVRFTVARLTMSGGRLVRAGTPAGSGLVVGALLAVELHAYGYHAPPSGDFGWYAYSPLGSDGVLYGGGPVPSGWPLLVTGAVVGVLVGVVAAGAALWTTRSRA